MNRVFAVARATCALSAVTLSAVACGGPVHITGSLGDRVPEAAGTAVAWVDATEFVDGGTGAITRVDRATDATVLHVAFFEAAFDPLADVSLMTAGERAARADAIAHGDQIRLTVQRGEALRDGDEIATLPSGGLPPQVLPFIVGVDVVLVDGGGVDYPEQVQQVGSVRTATLDVDTVAPDLVGSLAVTADAAAGEDDAATGEFAVDFRATVVPERLGECNFDRENQAVLDPCTLAPR